MKLEALAMWSAVERELARIGLSIVGRGDGSAFLVDANGTPIMATRLLDAAVCECHRFAGYPTIVVDGAPLSPLARSALERGLSRFHNDLHAQRLGAAS